MKAPTIKWFQSLVGGMDQATDTTMVANNDSPLIVNMVLDQPGNIATRKGSTKVGGTLSETDEGWGLFSYNATNGTRKLMASTEQDLLLYDEGGSSWSTVATDAWPADTKVNSINFLNRLYFGSADGATALKYSTGGSLTTVHPLIGGHILAVNKEILSVGGNSIKPNIIFYTDEFTDTFYSATGTCSSNADSAGANTVTSTTAIFEADMEGSILYNTTESVMALIVDWRSSTSVLTDIDTSSWDNDTVYVLQNNFKLDNACTGSVAYGENFVSFDLDKMYMWDPTAKWSSTLSNFGCVNERTVQVVNGNLIWANREGIYMFTGEGIPIDITGKIRDRVNGYGIWDLITTSNWAQAASWFKPAEGKYYLSLGDLQTVTGAPASGLTNVVLEYDTRRSTWLLRTYPDEFLDFTTFVNSTGSKDIYSISKAKAVVRKLDTGETDVDNDGATAVISWEYRTPHHLLGNPSVTQAVLASYAKYTSTNDITVTQSVSRGSYSSVGTLTSSATVKVQELNPPPQSQGFSHGLKFVGTAKVVLEGYGFKFSDDATLRVPSK